MLRTAFPVHPQRTFRFRIAGCPRALGSRLQNERRYRENEHQHGSTLMERVEGWELKALTRTCLFSLEQDLGLAGPVCIQIFFSPRKVRVGLHTNDARARARRRLSVSRDMTTKMYNHDEQGPRTFEQKPLLLIVDGDGPYSGIGRMNRPFGTSSKRYWALFVFVMLSIVQNIVSDK